jgi:hypothetical protein
MIPTLHDRPGELIHRESPSLVAPVIDFAVYL